MAVATAVPALDLLHPTPSWRIDFEGTRVAIHLAFAGGVSGGLFSEALEHATFAPSTWDSNTFANDLFLQRFVTHCLRIRIGRQEPLANTTHLTRLLAQPPVDPSIVRYRRAILAELVEVPELRPQLERLYLDICRLRALLENSGNLKNWDPNRRQLDVLGVLKEIIDGLSTGFRTARSGLHLLNYFGESVRRSEPYQALSDLLSFDGQLATLSLNVEVGADGRLRGFQIQALRENQENPFVNPAWRRWLAKLELFVRGYKFGDGEIMARLVDAVFSGLEDVTVGLVQLLGDLEFYLAALSFRDHAASAGLAVCLPELVEAHEPRVLLGLFNPFLLAQGSAVPCNLVSDSFTTTTLVTGPNSGGKTRLLQAIGLAQVLAQAGLFVPARSGSIALTQGLVVSLIEETKSDQTEGRLGMELMRIRTLF
ncbi:MAG TPA: DNA mismatch repair protein, partial [Polyangiaceae bacterium]|nr:DNA mismatch repair protein [Polyangiaceae bacterium]